MIKRCKHKIETRQCSECGDLIDFNNRLARSAKSTLRLFLKQIEAPVKKKKYGDEFSKTEIKFLVSERFISSKILLKATKGFGWPDFRKEYLEEKGPKQDWLSVVQWARAILEYRAGRKYKVVWRFTSTRRKVFQTVYDFYIWQQSLASDRRARRRN
jgi:hypothetical protein